MVRLSLSPSTSLFLEARECGRHKYWPQSFFGRAVSYVAPPGLRDHSYLLTHSLALWATDISSALPTGCRCMTRALPLLTRGLLTPSSERQLQLNVPLPLSAQLLLQHCESAVQAALTGRQLAAAAAVGTTIEVIRGTVTAAAIPRRFTRVRRDI